MHEQLNQWDFVAAAYVIGITGTLAMVAWSVTTMRRAERRRDASRRKTSQ
ncbi:hypothetical protein ACFO0A_08295 [Novosphingobium tardum]|jgi:uncharacterized membrane protein|uniref:Heme exporter protein D n=1 Tax=Novosphingobium tardum TaxID=1538021 RepID=A0ABV8RNV6_9SPHN